MRHRTALGLVCLLALIGCGGTTSPPASAPSETDTAPRGMSFVAPLKNEAPGESAGLFIGVNEFSQDDGIATLNYAVNDAVELAHLFVLELRLIPPKHCALCLGGGPSGDEAQKHLRELESAGATIHSTADKASMLKAFSRLRDVKFSPQNSLAVVSLSTHGLFDEGIPYVIPADGLRDFLGQTALPLTVVEEQLAATKAGHRLLLVDACQERVPARALGDQLGTAMSDEFRKALEKPTGQTKIAACSPGEFSFEIGALKQGVFTHAFLTALRGRASPDASNLIRLGAVVDATRQGVTEWAENNRRKQTVFFSGPLEARDLPLAARADDLDALGSQLAKRITGKPTGYTDTLHKDVLALLPRLENDRDEDRQFMEATREFAQGRMAEFVYLPLLKERLRDSSPAVASSSPRPAPPQPARKNPVKPRTEKPSPGSPGPAPVVTTPSAPATTVVTAPEPVLSGGPVTVKLPSPPSRIVPAAGGRLLILHLPAAQQLGVFDVAQARFLKFLPLDSGDIVFAAGAEKLFVGDRENDTLQRWDLRTLEPEMKGPAPRGGLGALAMGADAVAPLILLAIRSEKKSYLIDPVTLQAEPHVWKGWSGGAWGPVSVHVSFDGSTAVACGGGWAGVELATMAGGRIVSSKTGSYVQGDTFVSGNGALVFPEEGGILRADLETTIDSITGTPFPALDPGFSLALTPRGGKTVLTVFSNTDGKRVATITDVPELQAKSTLSLPERAHLIPRLGVLVTLDEAREQLVRRPWDLAQALEAEGIDYLFVESSPPRGAVAGREYTYPVRVRSRKGSVRYALQASPMGMTVSPAGVIAWNVPAAQQKRDVFVVLQIQDAAGQELSHRFWISVTDTAPPDRPVVAAPTATSTVPIPVAEQPPLLEATSGFNDAKGLNADATPDSPFLLEAKGAAGQGEKGWARPWEEPHEKARFQKSVVYEGDGALFMEGTSGMMRQLVVPYRGLVEIEQYVQVPPGGDLTAYHRETKDDASASQWFVKDGQFVVLDGDEDHYDQQRRKLNTGFECFPDQWYKVTVRINFNTKRWEFWVGDKKFNHAPLRFRGKAEFLQQIAFLTETAPGVYIDAVRIRRLPDPE